MTDSPNIIDISHEKELMQLNLHRTMHISELAKYQKIFKIFALRSLKNEISRKLPLQIVSKCIVFIIFFFI